MISGFALILLGTVYINPYLITQVSDYAGQCDVRSADDRVVRVKDTTCETVVKYLYKEVKKIENRDDN